MQASSLRVGDRFVELPPNEFAQLSNNKRKQQSVYVVTKIDELLPPACPGQMHLAVRGPNNNYGHWCAPLVHEVTRVDA